MFINLSSDNIYILTWESRIDISRGQLERNISQSLLDIYSQYKPDNIYILNWPWSFTNLRLGSLAINLLLFILKQEGQNIPNIYISDKISVYKTINHPIAIYIWQKNNYRWMQDWKTETINYSDISNNSYLDDLSDNININLPKLQFSYKNDHIYIDSIDISWLFKKLEWDITPNYMIEPNIS